MQDKEKAVLVIGAGVGGIRASLDLAESGHKVYLTDRSPGIGGALYQLDTWFPDNQCELCKLLPVFSRDECSQVCLRRDLMHPNIEVMPNATITRLSGEAGNFTATMNVKSRWVKEERCTACGLCAVVCPVEVTDEFNRSLQKRKAVYVRNPQAVPNVYAIDRDTCTRCGKCVEICPTRAIVLDLADETKDLKVGAVVVSAGSQEFDAKSMQQYGFGRYPNVVSNIQLERLLADAGPTGGELKRPSDGKTPKKIAILQCIGSRDMERNYCSEVCCMYALKEAQMLRDRYPDADVTIFYMDLRAFGKDYYRYHLQAKEKGVKFARSRVSRIRENPKTRDLYLLARDEAGKSLNAEYDMVVLSMAQCPPPYLAELSRTLNLATNRWGFIDTAGFYLVRTSRPGIFVSGSASGPSDIAETVIKSSAAACEAAIISGTQKAPEAKPAEHEHNVPAEEEAKVAVFLCKCGQEVASVVDMAATKAFAQKLAGVTLVEDSNFICLPESLDKVKEAVKKAGANRVIMAACAPYHYQRLFSETLAEAGIDASEWQLVNLREQLAWVHKDSKKLATEKAQRLVEMAVERLRTQEPLKAPTAPIAQNCLVVGGGISGITSALSLAGQGFDVTLAEKTNELGGHSRGFYYDLNPDDPQALVKGAIDKVKSNPRIKVMLNSELASIRGHIGNFKSQVKSANGQTAEIKHGAVIIATGAADYTPTEYVYGNDPRVITQHELQRRLAEGKLGKPSTIVMIQCVGSRNQAHPYCNRICCSEAIANALKIKETSPETQVFVLNRDIMAYGFREPYYTKAREAGVLFHRFELEAEPKVTSGEKALIVEWPDPVLPGRLAIDADLLVLSTGYVAAESNAAIAKMLGLELTADGFFKEMDTKFRPVDAVLDGVFLTGLANAPRNLGEKIIEAQAAAQRAANILSRQQLTSGGVISEVDKRRCSCCGLCVEACPFGARSLDEEEHYAVVEETLCQGCGMCVAVCPNDAAKLRGQKDKQVMSMLLAGI